MSEVVQWVVAANEGAVRLDTFLATRLQPLPRRDIAALIASGQVLLNGRTSKKGLRVHAGDTVTAPVVCSVRPNPALPIAVVYADDTVVVLDKPAGIPSLALRHTETDAVTNFLVARFPETVTVGPRPLESGLVHRLDTPTSGLLLAARTPAAYASLRKQWSARTVEKQYLAVVAGQLQAGGQVSCGLAPAGPRGQRMRVVAPGQGQAARTLYAPVEALPGYTLVRVTLATGVRHQIRAHLAALGHPIVGDTCYGAAAQTVRLCLHAEALAFLHPTTGQHVRFTSPTPPDFSAFVEHLRARVVS